MIFVTVGGQIPFDRLIKTVDQWAADRARTDVVAQIGASEYRPRAMRYERFFGPAEFRRNIDEAAVVIAHAGMGTILTALQARKPILVMPRRAHLRETRNDHQLATVQHLAERWRIVSAQDESALVNHLENLDALTVPTAPDPQEAERLVLALRTFVASL